jgi:hypothetical protein
MSRLYPYIGPKKIADRVHFAPPGIRIGRPNDLVAWIRQTAQLPDDSGELTATFVIDESGALRIADRRSEHVACAGGKAVQSAGEITFRLGTEPTVIWVTNQSTGYCPEPESWPAVASALEHAGFHPADGFDLALEFRRCTACGSINIVKNGVFECAVCSAPLPGRWNLRSDDAA